MTVGGGDPEKMGDTRFKLLLNILIETGILKIEFK